MQVFIFNLTDISDEKLNKAKQLLCVSERQRLDNMISVKRRKEFILGHFLLRQQLSRFLVKSPEQIKVESLPSGALYLPDFKDVFASISHSFNYLAIAVGKTPVGVDIEKINMRDNFWELLNQIGAFEKAKELTEQGVCAKNAFYHFWTRKEALYKLKSQSLIEAPVFHYFCYDDYMLCTASESEECPEWINCSVEIND